jgi:hypothetical protein
MDLFYKVRIKRELKYIFLTVVRICFRMEAFACEQLGTPTEANRPIQYIGPNYTRLVLLLPCCRTAAVLLFVVFDGQYQE